MASQPIMRKLESQLARIAKEHNLETPDDVLFGALIEGVPLKELMEPFGLHRTMFYQWLKKDPKRKLRYEQEVKPAMADRFVEEATTILDTANPITNADANIVKARASHRTWLAGKFSKVYSDDVDQSINVNFDLGAAHLDAIKRLGVPEADYKILDNPDNGEDGDDSES